MRCGPKVLAEKAKYYRPKSVGSHHGAATNATASESSESTAAGELHISQTSVSVTDYGHPPDSHTSIEPSQLGIEMDGGDIPKDKDLIFESGTTQIYHLLISRNM